MPKPNVIFLHGWGTTSDSLYPLIERLRPQAVVFTPNLPYPQKKVLTLDDYCDFVLDFIKTKKIKNPVIVGHSLGGAIACKIAVDRSDIPSKIVLLSAAAIRHSLPAHIQFFQKISKPFSFLRIPVLKLLKLDASDYLTLKTVAEKETFKNLIAADLTPLLPQISLPALILWGDNDTSTFLDDGLKIHSLIKNSIFLSFPNTGHFFYLDYPDKTAGMIKDFLKK